MTRKSWQVLPKTMLGKWSIGFIIAMPLLFVIGISFANSIYESDSAGDTILADISARPALALTMLAGMISGFLALLVGLVAIFREKEKAILVYVSCTIGGILVVFLIGEMAFSH